MQLALKFAMAKNHLNPLPSTDNEHEDAGSLSAEEKKSRELQRLIDSTIAMTRRTRARVESGVRNKLTVRNADTGEVVFESGGEKIDEAEKQAS